MKVIIISGRKEWFIKNLRTLKLLMHLVGVASLCGTIALTALVFWTIAFKGAFTGTEPNLYILFPELSLPYISVTYLAYLIIDYIDWENLKPRRDDH